MRDYSKASVLVVPNEQLVDLTAICSFFTQFVVNSPPDFKAITLTHHEVTGEIAYIIWKAEPFITVASDSSLMRDDTWFANNVIQGIKRFLH
jgi:hypothetical protein